jgi:hypothetical protein
VPSFDVGLNSIVEKSLKNLKVEKNPEFIISIGRLPKYP